jgi:dTDP-4-dehydro-6-deoxy-alpha-D-glucopyranose 2,3-dehydratase
VIADWFSSLLADANCRVEWMPLARSNEWRLEGGRILHRSNGFFTVVGVQWTSRAGDVVQQPLLDQQEVGTLGFLVRERYGRRQLLAQGKVEPGNVGFVQLAPTCQATDSNARRLHGGASPPYIELFPPSSPHLLYDVAQSEQGSRFLRKRNRNVLALAQADAPVPPSHRWLDTEAVLGLLWRDYVVNTDARSVLVCAPWERLVGRVPFSKDQRGFGPELLVSLEADSRHASLPDVKAHVDRLRAAVTGPDVVALDDLPGWRWTEEGLSPSQGTSRCVRHVRVSVKGREVPAWDQPIVDCATDGAVTLVCARIEGILHFLFRAQAEPGLCSRVELTPTVVLEPGASGATPAGRWPGTVVAQCRQSEEGGRFYRDTNVYRILDAGIATEAEPDQFWLTLGDVRLLLDEPGWLTNEARSALSLLLPWM